MSRYSALDRSYLMEYFNAGRAGYTCWAVATVIGMPLAVLLGGGSWALTLSYVLSLGLWGGFVLYVLREKRLRRARGAHDDPGHEITASTDR
jgi:predicted MFS family arabinose efflux permease